MEFGVTNLRLWQQREGYFRRPRNVLPAPCCLRGRPGTSSPYPGGFNHSRQFSDCSPATGIHSSDAGNGSSRSSGAGKVSLDASLLSPGILNIPLVARPAAGGEMNRQTERAEVTPVPRKQ